MQKFFYKCDRAIFREPYSGVFKPYSDVLKSYSGVFLQNFFIIVVAPYSGCPTVAFSCKFLISPILGSRSLIVVKHYNDVLKPYSGVFLQKFFIIVVAPYSRCPIVVFLRPIVTF